MCRKEKMSRLIIFLAIMLLLGLAFWYVIKRANQIAREEGFSKKNKK